MSAKTSWWFCGRCGFQNRPRRSQDNTKCEQCGHSQTDPADLASVANDTDYTPTAGH